MNQICLTSSSRGALCQRAFCMPEVSLIKVIFLNTCRLMQSLPASPFPPKHGGRWARWPRTVGWGWFISLSNGIRYDGRGGLSQKQQQKKNRRGEKKEGEGRGEKKKGEKKKQPSKAKLPQPCIPRCWQEHQDMCQLREGQSGFQSQSK